jgi:hypothetical protein
MQLSTSTTAGNQKVLVYDQTREYTYETEATEEVRQLMKGRLKVYFAARMNGSRLKFLMKLISKTGRICFSV